MKVLPDNIQKGPLRYPALPDAFVERVKAYKRILAEVEPAPLEDTLADFMRDANPERELAIWECIAAAYDGFVSEQPSVALAAKREAFRVLVACSIGSKDFGEHEHLSDDDVQQLVRRYRDDRVDSPHDWGQRESA